MFLPDQLPSDTSSKIKRQGAITRTKFPPTEGTDEERIADEDSDSCSSAENAPAHEEDPISVATGESSGTATSMRVAVERGLVASFSSYVPRKT